MNDPETPPAIPPAERIRTLAGILSGRLTVRDAARRHGLPVRVVERWLREIPVAVPEDRTARAVDDGTTPAPAPARTDSHPRPHPLPRCRIVVDAMVQGLGL